MVKNTNVVKVLYFQRNQAKAQNPQANNQVKKGLAPNKQTNKQTPIHESGKLLLYKVHTKTKSLNKLAECVWQLIAGTCWGSSFLRSCKGSWVVLFMSMFIDSVSESALVSMSVTSMVVTMFVGCVCLGQVQRPRHDSIMPFLKRIILAGILWATQGYFSHIVSTSYLALLIIFALLYHQNCYNCFSVFWNIELFFLYK